MSNEHYTFTEFTISCGRFSSQGKFSLPLPPAFAIYVCNHLFICMNIIIYLKRTKDIYIVYNTHAFVCIYTYSDCEYSATQHSYTNLART